MALYTRNFTLVKQQKTSIRSRGAKDIISFVLLQATAKQQQANSSLNRQAGILSMTGKQLFCLPVFI